MKRRLLFLGFGSALLVTMGGVSSAQADNGPHVSSAATTTGVASAGTDRCASCHRVHTAKGADYLLTTGQEGMCITCHGSTGTGAATNVVDGVGYENSTGTQNRDRSTPAGALRGGGFKFALIGSGSATRDMQIGSRGLSATNQKIPALTAGKATTSTHSVDGTAGTAWGNGAISATASAGKSVTLECGSCHDPHGNGNYRILKPMPVDSGYVPYVLTPAKAAVIADPSATPPIVGSPAVPAVMSATGGIKIPDASVKKYTTTDYWQTGDPSVLPTVNGATAVSPDGFIANISDWCSTCHTRYNAKSGSRSLDSGDAVFTYRHTTTKIDKVGTRNCITCHVAHGSNALQTGGNSSAVAMPDGAAAPAGDSKLLRVDNRGICLMCHNL